VDPGLFKSGKSVEKRPRISRGGSRHLRHALYMPASCSRCHAKTVARAVCYVPHPSTVRRFQAVCSAPSCQCGCGLRLRDHKERGFSAPLPERKNFEIKQEPPRIYNQHVRLLLLRALWLVGASKVYSGL